MLGVWKGTEGLCSVYMSTEIVVAGFEVYVHQHLQLTPQRVQILLPT